MSCLEREKRQQQPSKLCHTKNWSIFSAWAINKYGNCNFVVLALSRQTVRFMWCFLVDIDFGGKNFVSLFPLNATEHIFSESEDERKIWWKNIWDRKLIAWKTYNRNHQKGFKQQEGNQPSHHYFLAITIKHQHIF